MLSTYFKSNDPACIPQWKQESDYPRSYCEPRKIKGCERTGSAKKAPEI